MVLHDCDVFLVPLLEARIAGARFSCEGWQKFLVDFSRKGDGYQAIWRWISRGVQQYSRSPNLTLLLALPNPSLHQSFMESEPKSERSRQMMSHRGRVCLCSLALRHDSLSCHLSLRMSKGMLLTARELMTGQDPLVVCNADCCCKCCRSCGPWGDVLVDDLRGVSGGQCASCGGKGGSQNGS